MMVRWRRAPQARPQAAAALRRDAPGGARSHPARPPEEPRQNFGRAQRPGPDRQNLPAGARCHGGHSRAPEFRLPAPTREPTASTFRRAHRPGRPSNLRRRPADHTRQVL